MEIFKYTIKEISMISKFSRGCIIHYILILKFAVVKFEYTKYFFAVLMNLLNVKENELIILKIVFELIWIPWGRVCNAIETWGIRKCYFHK